MKFEQIEEIEKTLSNEEKGFIQAQANIAHQARICIHKICVQIVTEEGKEWSNIRYKCPLSVFDKETERKIDNLVTLSNIISVNNDGFLTDPEWVNPIKKPNLEY